MDNAVGRYIFVPPNTPGFAVYATDGILGWIGRVRKIVSREDIENASRLQVTFTDGTCVMSMSDLTEYACHKDAS